MMIRPLLAAPLIAALMIGVVSLPVAPALAQDARLVERMYNPDRVVRVEGRVNVQSTIRFADNETIENVAIGDSQSWQVTPNRRANLLFVKPLSPRASTNMTVVTDRRTYLFDLVANPNTRSPLYILSFTYPPEPDPVEEPVELAAGAMPVPPGDSANALEMAAATDDLAVVDPTQLNFQWAGSGASALLPMVIYDNGNATFMEWPADRALPAILVKDHLGTEGPANFAVRGDTIVVEGVPAEIVLRSGEDVATLINERPAVPVGSEHPSSGPSGRGA